MSGFTEASRAELMENANRASETWNCDGACAMRTVYVEKSSEGQGTSRWLMQNAPFSYQHRAEDLGTAYAYSIKEEEGGTQIFVFGQQKRVVKLACDLFLDARKRTFKREVESHFIKYGVVELRHMLPNVLGSGWATDFINYSNAKVQRFPLRHRTDRLTRLRRSRRAELYPTMFQIEMGPSQDSDCTALWKVMDGDEMIENEFGEPETDEKAKGKKKWGNLSRAAAKEAEERAAVAEAARLAAERPVVLDGDGQVRQIMILELDAECNSDEFLEM